MPAWLCVSRLLNYCGVNLFTCLVNLSSKILGICHQNGRLILVNNVQQPPHLRFPLVPPAPTGVWCAAFITNGGLP